MCVCVCVYQGHDAKGLEKHQREVLVIAIDLKNEYEDHDTKGLGKHGYCRYSLLIRLAKDQQAVSGVTIPAAVASLLCWLIRMAVLSVLSVQLRAFVFVSVAVVVAAGTTRLELLPAFCL